MNSNEAPLLTEEVKYPDNIIDINISNMPLEEIIIAIYKKKED